jgi:molybdate transport system substrate-binding protein
MAVRAESTSGLRLLAGVLAAAMCAVPARAAAPDVIVYGDPALARPLHDVAARFTAQTGVPVHVFTTSPTLILAQLRHEVWNDVVVTLAPWMDQAEKAGVIDAGTRTGAWRTTLVIAKPEASGSSDVFAVTDPTPAASIDGLAVMAALGLHPAKIQGVANGANVAFLLDTGAASEGLLHLTEVRADSRLRVAASVADSAYPPIIYDAAISTLTHSPNARAFLAYLHSPTATEVLQADGVETVK